MKKLYAFTLLTLFSSLALGEHQSRATSDSRNSSDAVSIHSIVSMLESRLDSCKGKGDCVDLTIERPSGKLGTTKLSAGKVQRLRLLFKHLARFQSEMEKYCIKVIEPDPTSVKLAKHLEDFLSEFVIDLGTKGQPRLAIREEALTRELGHLAKFFQHKKQMFPSYGELEYNVSAREDDNALVENFRDMAFVLGTSVEGTPVGFHDSVLAEILEDFRPNEKKPCANVEQKSTTNTQPTEKQSPPVIEGEGAILVGPDGKPQKRIKIKAGESFELRVPVKANGQEIKPYDNNIEGMVQEKSFDPATGMAIWKYTTHPLMRSMTRTYFYPPISGVNTVALEGLGVKVIEAENADAIGPVIDVSKMRVSKDGVALEGKNFPMSKGDKPLQLVFPIEDPGGSGVDESSQGSLTYQYSDDSFSSASGKVDEKAGTVTFEIMPYDYSKPGKRSITYISSPRDRAGNYGSFTSLEGLSFEIIHTPEQLAAKKPEFNPADVEFDGNYLTRSRIVRFEPKLSGEEQASEAGDALSLRLRIPDGSNVKGGRIYFQQTQGTNTFTTEQSAIETEADGSAVLKFSPPTGFYPYYPGLYRITDVELTDKFDEPTKKKMESEKLIFIPKQFSRYEQHTIRTSK